jgi:hypothetical protein
MSMDVQKETSEIRELKADELDEVINADCSHSSSARWSRTWSYRRLFVGFRCAAISKLGREALAKKRSLAETSKQRSDPEASA